MEGAPLRLSRVSKTALETGSGKWGAQPPQAEAGASGWKSKNFS